MVSTIAVQTRATNTTALALYRALGFTVVETSTFYRLPPEIAARSAQATDFAEWPLPGGPTGE